MIKIVIRKTEGSAQFILSGHAGYADPGQDIVCAGVSMLTNTLANLVQRWNESGSVELMQIYPADAPRHIFLTTGADRTINATIDTIVDQYEQIAEQYPQHVTVEILP